MRKEWLPLSAASLVTGVMVLILAQLLNPAGPDVSPAAQLSTAAESPGRWQAVSVLYFLGAVTLVLGLPSVLTLFPRPRGRGTAIVGSIVFTVGCIGLGGLAAMMLLFRAVALQLFEAGSGRGSSEVQLMIRAVEDTSIALAVGMTVTAFLGGLFLLALALWRARVTAAWVPGVLLGYLALELVLMALPQGSQALRVAEVLPLLLLAAAFTAIAMAATAPRQGPALA